MEVIVVDVEKWLQEIADTATGEAYRARQEGEDRGDRESVGRAWERLHDAADALHAFSVRRAAYEAACGAPESLGDAGA